MSSASAPARGFARDVAADQRFRQRVHGRRARLAVGRGGERGGELLVMRVERVADDVVERVVPQPLDPDRAYDIIAGVRPQVGEQLLHADDVIGVDVADHGELDDQLLQPAIGDDLVEPGRRKLS
jgi:hypothetical protein